MYKIFIKLLYFSLTVIKILFKSKEDLIFENMALRQQLVAYLIKREKPKITDIDRSFWIAMKQIWPKWIYILLIVKPETVINWQKQRFKDYWRKKSLKNRKPVRLLIDKEIINLISLQVKQLIKNRDIKPKLISYQAPWQNGVAERWILSARDDLLNHIIVLSEEHLRRILREYVKYYNNDRCHLTLNKITPRERAVQQRPSEAAKVISISRLGGLHHKYEWQEAA